MSDLSRRSIVASADALPHWPCRSRAKHAAFAKTPARWYFSGALRRWATGGAPSGQFQKASHQPGWLTVRSYASPAGAWATV